MVVKEGGEGEEGGGEFFWSSILPSIVRISAFFAPFQNEALLLNPSLANEPAFLLPSFPVHTTL
jgi:hypothetical protein